MSKDSSKRDLSLDEQLVAYLDGELDPEGRRHIESLLASDPKVRRRLQSLEQTWDLLDELEAAPASEPLTRTTLEMVALAASNDAQQAVQRRRSRRWQILAALIAAAAIGYCGVAWLTPDPNYQLVRDLPILQRLDEYRQVENIDFLRQLRDQGLFLTPRNDSVADSPRAGSVEADRSPQALKGMISQMPVADKERLLRFYDRFSRLSEEEQQRLRQLHAALQHDPDAATLQRVMENYYDWLQTLSAYRRAELLDLKPKDRLAAVEKRWQSERRRDGDRRLSDKENEALLAFLQEFAARHESEFLAAQSDPKQRARLANLGPGLRHLAFFREVWQPWMAAGGKTPPPMMTEADWGRLKAALSPSMREKLEKMPAAEQWRSLADWLRMAVQQRAFTRGPRSHTLDEDQRLLEFFEHGLSDDERDRLLAMPSEEMLRQLQRMIWYRAKPFTAPPHRSAPRRDPQESPRRDAQ